MHMTPGESPDDNSYGADNYAEQPDEFDKEEYLPEYQELFPQFTLEDMDAVRLCYFEWYDGCGASYLYSYWDEK